MPASLAATTPTLEARASSYKILRSSYLPTDAFLESVHHGLYGHVICGSMFNNAYPASATLQATVQSQLAVSLTVGRCYTLKAFYTPHSFRKALYSAHMMLLLAVLTETSQCLHALSVCMCRTINSCTAGMRFASLLMHVQSQIHGRYIWLA